VEPGGESVPRHLIERKVKNKMLIDRYKDFPEGEIKDLISSLPNYYQERLEVVVHPGITVVSKDNISWSLVTVHCFDSRGLDLPVDRKTQSILDRLSKLFQKEYDPLLEE